MYRMNEVNKVRVGMTKKVKKYNIIKYIHSCMQTSSKNVF
jgi:hypothetical protein